MINELPRETHELLESKGIKITITKDEQTAPRRLFLIISHAHDGPVAYARRA
ncbi:hypothetical protein SETIT_3G253800v2 [Setaria italica]|uniref:Uncharacterized protein n=2 Tax=Setaria TaxID=4554 RepID=A0A368QIT1_SETIT|nr:hypothetical protein SETIT_3G253800v2 [Setaria italica]TKW27488.1 hypothetical protein SEVIR_3G260500v2 [Setaria viridis]